MLYAGETDNGWATVATPRLREAVRARAPHYLVRDVARLACMTTADLQQFVARRYAATDDQILILARRMSVT